MMSSIIICRIIPHRVALVMSIIVRMVVVIIMTMVVMPVMMMMMIVIIIVAMVIIAIVLTWIPHTVPSFSFIPSRLCDIFLAI